VFEIMNLAQSSGENAQGVERERGENRNPPETPIMSDTSDNISDKSLRERVHFEVPVLADQLYRSPDRQALRADITARYENTLRYLEDEK
jgi:hypothetical protein